MKKQSAANSSEKLKQLFEILALLRNSNEVAQFFTDLCTPSELEDMADRWAIVSLLKAGIPYREIHAETGVSTTTIGRVARSLEYGSGGYHLIYQRINKGSKQK